MSGLAMNEVGAALPEPTPVVSSTVGATNPQDAGLVPAQKPEIGTASGKNPQEHGWVEKNEYDYSTYMKSSKELAEAVATNESADLGVDVGDWASNAAIYNWDDDFGDVGPRHPELEAQLFGSENHVRTGIKFENLTTLDVHQEGDVRITPIRKFDDAGLHPVMLENVKLAGYNVPTPIQQYCIPAVKLGHDIVACAQTGSGKTAAFLVPVISKLMGKAKKLTAPRPNPVTYQEGITRPVRAEPLVLVVCPSRELATQIFDEARRFCYRSMLRPCVIYGGGPIGDQVRQLQKGCDILIGTPGRLVDFIGRPEVLTLKRLKYMIIDEADEMLQSDWEEELNKIMSGGDQEEGNIKYMLFSATFPKQARDLAKAHLAHVHVRIRVGRAGSSHLNIKQDVVYVEASMKRRAVEDLLLSTPPTRTIIFVNSKRAADELDDFLFNKNFPCVSIHSDRTQREREDCIRSFRLGKNPILIATGVSARGLDIHNVMHVINYDLPSSQYGGIEEYTHRIGRTGRIGNMGLATSFYNDRDTDLAENLTKTLLETHQAIPDFLQQHIPEGFTADGKGDVDKLKFEADSDYGDDDQAGDAPVEGEGGGDAWGATSGADAWGAPADASATPAPAGDVWGATPSAPTPVEAQAPAGDAWGTVAALVAAPAPVPTPSLPVAPMTPVAPMAHAPHMAAQPPHPTQVAPVAQAPHVAQAVPAVQSAQQWYGIPPTAPTAVYGAPVGSMAPHATPAAHAVQPAAPAYGQPAALAYGQPPAGPPVQLAAPVYGQAPAAPAAQPAPPGLGASNWNAPPPVQPPQAIAPAAQVAPAAAPTAPAAPPMNPWNPGNVNW